MSTVVILAGGRSTRMGRDKLMLEMDGQSLLERAVKEFSASFDRVLVSVADGKRYDVGAEQIDDIYPGSGPLAGIHAALTASRDELLFAVAADMPFASADAAMRMLRLCGGHDACVALDDSGRPEPLFACYSKKLLQSAEAALENGRRSVRTLFMQADVIFVPAAELGGEHIFENLNYPEDYERVAGKDK